MKRITKMLGLSAVMVLAFAAVAAASASASQPEVEGTLPTTFSGSGGEGKLETVAGRTVTCTGNSASGTVNSSTTVNNTRVTFSGCTDEFGSACTTSGQSSGTIRTNLIKGTLFYREAGSSKKVILLEPETGSVFATFVCGFGFETLEVTKKVLGEITEVGTNKYQIAFSQAGGVQVIVVYLDANCNVTGAYFLETKGSGIEPFGPEQSGIQGSDTITTSAGTKLVGSGCV